MSSPAHITTADSLAQSKESNNSSLPPPIMPSSSTKYVQVIAPSTLEEGYTFDAVHDGQVFQVTVPEGGVKAGESFSVPFVPQTDNDGEIYYAEAVPIATEVTPILNNNNNNNIHHQDGTTTTTTTTYTITTPPAPIGRWKDGLCDCCTPGCCHPSCLNSICFRQILMGQVLTRMQLTWCGNPAKTRSQYKQTFHTLLWLTISYWIVWIFFHCDDDNDHTNVMNGRNCHGWRHSVLGTVRIVWFVYTVIVMIKLRKAVRDRYKIPQTQCVGCEDCCCVVFCSCCTMAQLARQTADYERQRAYCCTETGLAEERYTLEEALVV